MKNRMDDPTEAGSFVRCSGQVGECIPEPQKQTSASGLGKGCRRSSR